MAVSPPKRRSKNSRLRMAICAAGVGNRLTTLACRAGLRTASGRSHRCCRRRQRGWRSQRRAIGISEVATCDHRNAEKPEEPCGDECGGHLLVARPAPSPANVGPKVCTASTCSNGDDRFRRSWKSPGANGKSSTLRARMSCATWTRASASRYGSGRNRTASTTLKIAAVPPMPRASVRIAVSANVGCFRRLRMACTMSLLNVPMGGLDAGSVPVVLPPQRFSG